MSKQKRQFKVIIEKDEDGWFIASVPALPGCHTQGKTYEQVIERIKEAIQLCLEVQRADHKYKKRASWQYQPRFFAIEDLVV